MRSLEEIRAKREYFIRIFNESQDVQVVSGILCALDWILEEEDDIAGEGDQE